MVKNKKSFSVLKILPALKTFIASSVLHKSETFLKLCAMVIEGKSSGSWILVFISSSM